MALLLKIFRRCVSGVCDTEATKKIKTITTRSLVENYASTFKPISKVKEQFSDLNDVFISALAVSVGEYDNRGKQGYVLAGQFFDWFEEKFKGRLSIEGPDAMLSSARSFPVSKDRALAISSFAAALMTAWLALDSHATMQHAAERNPTIGQAETLPRSTSFENAVGGVRSRFE
jgi:hypothetical protein